MGVNFTPTLNGYTGVGPFRFWCQTALPLVYDDSLSYYELLNKVVHYLNEVIKDVSSVEDNVQALLGAFNQLQDYVNHYFDNLDVQEEINKKLDGLAEDGTLSELISPFVSELIGGVVADQIGDTVASQIDATVAGQIVPVVAEQLRGSYGSPLVSSTLAGMTDRQRVYVYTGSEADMTNGDWYYWDGTQWSSGGVYNSEAITVDDELDENSINPVQNKVVTEAVGELKSALNAIVRLDSFTTVDKVLGGNGFLDNPDVTKQQKTTEIFSVAPNDVIIISLSLSEAKSTWIAYGTYLDGTWIERTVICNNISGSNFNYLITIPSGANGVRLSYTTYGIATVNIGITRNLNNTFKLATNAKKMSPFSLGMGADYGYLNSTTNLQLNRSATTSRVLFSTLLCGKGTKISKLDNTISTFEVRAYNPYTGAYVETIGNIASNVSTLTVNNDAIIAIYANTTYTNASSYYALLNNAIGIEYVEANIKYDNYNSFFEYGSLSNGLPSGNAQNRLRSKEFVFVGKGSVICLENSSYSAYITLYDINKNYITTSAPVYAPAYVVPYDCYIKIVGATGGTFASETVISPKMFYVSPNGEKLPSYYFEDDYIQDRCDEINSHNSDCAFGGLMFAFITDTHWDTNYKRSPLLMEYIKSNTEINDIVFNGDGITQYNTKNEAVSAYDKFRGAFSDFIGTHWYPVIGNHELNDPGASTPTKRLSNGEAYGLVVKEQERIITVIDELSYYVDCVNLKIRMIFVGCSYTSQIPVSTSGAVASVIGTTPLDYKIIVISHVGLTGTESTGTVDTTFQPILDALDAIHNNVICALTGHRHADGNIVTSNGVNVIATTTDGLNELGGLTRTRATINENAFDIVQIDTTNRKIYLTRIGAGSDRTFSY